MGGNRDFCIYTKGVRAGFNQNPASTKGGPIVAKNTGNNSRKGAVTGRSQVRTPNGWTKRDTGTGKFMDGKADAKPFKGVRREN